MPAKNRPYEKFASFLLFRKLESDQLSDLWRAGSISSINGNELGETVALRRFLGGNYAALTQSASIAREVVPLLTGTSFVKHQTIGVSPAGVPYLAHDYGGGRSLRHIIDKARGGTGGSPNPLPLDQAIAIAEKVALSVETVDNLKYRGNRLLHGALIPQFIWISVDGEIRVAGQQLGKGIVASLETPSVAVEIGPYFAPEYQSSCEASRISEVFSLGAILYLVVTGREPPNPVDSSSFLTIIRGAKLMAGGDIPADIRAILDKSLVLDPAARYGTASEMKQAISALAHGGRYSATTFNLAFYLSNLLRKELESEAIDRERESKVSVAAYNEQRPMTAEEAGAPPPLTVPEQRRSRAGLYLGIAAALAIVAGGAFSLLRTKAAAGKPAPTASAATPTAPIPATPSAAQQLAAEPIVSATPSPTNASTATAATTATPTATMTEQEQKAAFEEEVKRRLQGEMLKLQAEFNKQQPKTALSAPAASAAAPGQQLSAPAEDRSLSAAQPDQQRPDSQRQQAAAATETAVPAATQPAAPTAAPTATPTATPTPPAAPVIHEGDLVEISDVDSVPQPLQPIRPTYPPMALRQRVEATVILTALISETGQVLDVRIMRGAPMGLEDSAVSAVRATRFSPAMKDGKKVRTWSPVPVNFTLGK